MRRSAVAIVLSFLVGAGLMFASLRSLPFLQLGEGDVESLSLTITAVTNKSYRFHRVRGFVAVLVSEDGRRLELPVAAGKWDTRAGKGGTIDEKQ